MADSSCVLICRDRTCKKQGSLAVIEAFQRLCPAEWTIVGSHCMGQCGNGPMVRIFPGDIWYWRVQPEEVNAIVERHLIAGKPVKAMLYPTVHHRQKP